MTADQAVRLRAVLDDLENNRISIADAAAQVRTMKFPAPPPKTVGQRMADSYETEVPSAIPEGSFREVAQAYVQGRIDLRQYEALADAAAEAIGDRSPGHGSDSAPG